MSFHMGLVVVWVLVGAYFVVGDKFSTVAGHSKKVVLGNPLIANPDAMTPSAIQVNDNQNTKPYDAQCSKDWKKPYFDISANGLKCKYILRKKVMNRIENTIENNYIDNKSSYHNQEDGMSAGKVVIIVLILLLLLILLMCGWCFRSRLRVMAKPYWDNWTDKKTRKLSRAGLLQAYKKNKIHLPSLGPTKEEPNVPKAPPQDYSTSPSIPLVPPPPPIPVSFWPAPPNIPLPKIPHEEEDTKEEPNVPTVHLQDYSTPLPLPSVPPPPEPVSFRPAPPNIPPPKIPHEKEDTYSEITLN